MYGIEFPVRISTQHLTGPRLDVYYPSVTGLSNLSVQQKINRTILDSTYKVITGQGYYQDPRTEVTGSYEIKTNEKGILSLTLINDAYSGGAHGLRLIKPLTVDVETGKIYSLKELFKQNADYVKRLSNIVSKQIAERGLYLLGPFPGIRPDQEFYIADKALVIFFQLYELVPYASGIPFFPVSIYQIKDIINDKGPLNELMY